MAMITFSVCTLARETPDLLKSFANHYLNLGAESVRIFYDGEATEIDMPEIQGVKLTICDRQFWMQHMGQTPDNLDHAITTIFKFAHETSSSDWQFFCDSDEFLKTNLSIPTLLSQLPKKAEALRVMNVEAFWGPGANMAEELSCTYMRKRLGKWQDRFLRVLLPNRNRAFFKRGLVGHQSGKSFLKAGTKLDKYNSHYGIQNQHPVGEWAHKIGFRLEDLMLMHFDAVSAPRWIEKWRRRISKERPSTKMSSHRKLQFATIASAVNTGTIDRLFSDLYQATRYELFVLWLIRGMIRIR